MLNNSKVEKLGICFRLVRLCVIMIFICCFLVACSNNNITESSVAESTRAIEETKGEPENREQSSTVLCEVEGCYKTGYNAIEGFSGELEYYCNTHYNEIQDMLIGMLEDTVICEKDGCTKEGTYAIEGFSGQTEYYCYTHYNDILEMMSSLFNEPSYGDCDNCGRPAEYEWDENTAYCEDCFESLLNYIFNN